MEAKKASAGKSGIKGNLPILLTSGEVAKILKCTPQMVREYAEMGLLEYCQIPNGKWKRFTEKGVQRFLTRFTHKAFAID